MERREFLKTAAAVGTVTAAATGATSAATEKKSEKPTHPGDIVIERPGSDFMVDVIKTLDLEYMSQPIRARASAACTSRSSTTAATRSRSSSPACTRSRRSRMAHGYAKAAGKPMGALVHGTVGLQHAAMAIYNAWCDRVPMMIFAGNGIDASKRRPGTEWNHSVQDPALHGARLRQVGRLAGVAAALRRVHGARLQDRDDAADGAGADQRRHRPAGRRDPRARTCASRSSRARARRRATARRCAKRRSCWSARRTR